MTPDPSATPAEDEREPGDRRRADRLVEEDRTVEERGRPAGGRRRGSRGTSRSSRDVEVQQEPDPSPEERRGRPRRQTASHPGARLGAWAMPNGRITSVPQKTEAVTRAGRTNRRACAGCRASRRRTRWTRARPPASRSRPTSRPAGRRPRARRLRAIRAPIPNARQPVTRSARREPDREEHDEDRHRGVGDRRDSGIDSRLTPGDQPERQSGGDHAEDDAGPTEIRTQRTAWAKPRRADQDAAEHDRREQAGGRSSSPPARAPSGRSR